MLHESRSSLPCFLFVDLLFLHGSCPGLLPLGIDRLVDLVPPVGRRLLLVQGLAGPLALGHRGRVAVLPPCCCLSLSLSLSVGGGTFCRYSAMHP